MGKKEKGQDTMKSYSSSACPFLDDIASVTKEASELLTKSFLQHDGRIVKRLSLELLVRFVSVYRYEASDPDESGEYSGWVIGGNIPFLELSDEEVNTPIEAIAVYALSLYPWLRAKGVDQPVGSIAAYCVPPHWHPLTFAPGYEESRIGGITTFMEWHLIPANPTDVLHPEIRECCVQRGWLR